VPQAHREVLGLLVSLGHQSEVLTEKMVMMVGRGLLASLERPERR